MRGHPVIIGSIFSQEILRCPQQTGFTVLAYVTIYGARFKGPSTWSRPHMYGSVHTNRVLGGFNDYVCTGVCQVK